jgi:drug/metabolite transporter (DMT)-like permease
MLIFERFTIPGPEALLCIIASAALLTLGQLMLFSAYRVGEMGVVAPFMYASTVWALLLGAVVFNTVPNALALVGIAMIVVSGVLVVLFDRRARRAAVPE